MHANHNDWADSSRPAANGPAAEHGGLSALGREGVRRLNDLGVAIDVSQLSAAALEQTLKLTRVLVLASHSGVRALLDVSRNLSDAELDMIKVNGGVVHIVAYNRYLANPPADFAAREAGIRARWGLKPGENDRDRLNDEQVTRLHSEINALIPRANVSTLAEQVAYAARRIGVDHVGIASDFNHGGGIIGWMDSSEAPGVTAALLARGFSASDIGKIWSGNALRVLAAAEAGRRS